MELSEGPQISALSHPSPLNITSSWKETDINDLSRVAKVYYPVSALSVAPSDTKGNIAASLDRKGTCACEIYCISDSDAVIFNTVQIICNAKYLEIYCDDEYTISFCLEGVKDGESCFFTASITGSWTCQKLSVRFLKLVDAEKIQIQHMLFSADVKLHSKTLNSTLDLDNVRQLTQGECI